MQLDTGKKAVEVRVKYAEGTLWASEAGKRLPVYDHVERSWRHLDTCAFETRLICRVPRGADASRQGGDGAGAVGGSAQPLYVALRALRD